MIICHSRKFIFVHLHKCAGTSVTEALRPYLASDDIVLKGGEQSTNSSRHCDSSPRQLRKHSTAEEIAGAVGEEVWNSYFTFGLVRHPLDRLVSLYEFFIRVRRNNEIKAGLVKRLMLGNPSPSPKDYPKEQPWTWKGMQALLTTKDFSGFIRSGFLAQAQGAKPQARSLTDKSGNLLVDFVGKFENITDDWQTICRKLNVESTLLHTNQSQREHRDLRQYWSADNLGFVEDKYRTDFELFEYSPNDIFGR